MTFLQTLGVEETLAFLLDRGGWTLIVLCFLSVLVLATAIVSILRFVALRPFAINSGACRELEGHIVAIRSTAPTPVALEEEAGLMARVFLARARSGTRLLELIITAAPLLGLLGTVLGLISAFQAMQNAGNAVRPADLAGGIWEALFTTAAGMIVALVALVVHSLVEAVADSFRTRLEIVATRTLARSLKQEDRSSRSMSGSDIFENQSAS
ncbi:MAG: MotA/TolQ/ExbB proton channel family protein [Pseudomonadota bacterium]